MYGKRFSIVGLALMLWLALSPLGAVQAAKPGDPERGIRGGYTGAGDPGPALDVEQVISSVNARFQVGTNGKAELVHGDPQGFVDVLVVMEGAPLAEIYKEVKARRGPAEAARDDYQVAYSNRLKAQQAAVAAAAQKVSAYTSNLTMLVNGVAVSYITRAEAARLAAMPGVVDVIEFGVTKLDLKDSVPFVGAEQVRQTLGLDGRNIRVGIIDTGIDYTHRNFGGPGTPAAYQAASSGTNPLVITDTYNGVQLFPTQKIPGGYDFVGDNYTCVPTCGPRRPDPDPLDENGHGSHVAGITAGFGVPNSSINGSIPITFEGRTTGTPVDPPLYHGVAPAAQLYAYKTCSLDSCPNLAIVEAFEHAMDPNQNGSLSDHLDVVNTSLGSGFGLSGTGIYRDVVNRAVDVGVAVAMSAGNNANVPFITGSPATAEKVLSTASTLSGGRVDYVLTFSSPMTLTTHTVPFIWQNWSAPLTGTTGSLIEARNVVPSPDPLAKIGCTVNGQNPFPAGSLAGKIAVIDRGTCAISQKAYNAQLAGAIGVIVVSLPGQQANAAAWGGEPVTISTVMVNFDPWVPVRNYMAAGGDVVVVLEWNRTIARPELADVISGFTSSGPSALLALKPDIAAPGSDIISTDAGTGDKGTSISGTSMAAPHVAGGLALMKQLHPTWSAVDIEALLVNSSKQTLYINSNANPANEAPISRVGAGRLDLVAASRLLTTVRGETGPNVYFGIPVVTDTMSLSRVFTITNHSDVTKTYSLAVSHQFTAPGVAVALNRSSVTVGPGGWATATLNMNLNAAQLRSWALTGSGVFNPAALSLNEAAGRILVTDQNGQLAHMAWYVLPHRAADVAVSDETLTIPGQTGTVQFAVRNNSALTNTTELFHLVGHEWAVEVTSTDQLLFKIKNVGVRAGQRNFGGTIGITDTLSFAIDTVEPHIVGATAQFEVGIDNDRNGDLEFILVNYDLGFFQTGTLSGQQVTLVLSNTTGTNFTAIAAYSPVDSGLASSVTILHAPTRVLKLAPGQVFDFDVSAYDFDAGDLIDVAPDAPGVLYSFDPSSPRFTLSTYTVTTGVAAGTTQTVTVGVNLTEVPSSEIGVLAVHRQAGPPDEAEEILIGQMSFSDVSPSDYFYHAVEYLYLRGIVSGYENNTFRPYNNVTRGQVSKIIVLASGLPLVTPATPTFSDVPTTDPFYTFVESAVAAGVVSGYDDRTFRPYNNVTRGQLAKMVVLAFGLPLVNPASQTFSDVPPTNPFYTFIETAAANGFVAGYADRTFRWQNDATRGQVASITIKIKIKIKIKITIGR